MVDTQTQDQHARPVLDAAALKAVLAQALEIADPEQRVAAYDAATGGTTLNLATAENVLLYDSLRENVFTRSTVELDDIRYSTSYGTETLRRDVTVLLQQTFSPAIEWQNVYATAGVSGALESLAFALRDGGVLDRGDRVLLPAPCWQGFRWCFEQRPGLHCVPAPLLKRGEDRFHLTLDDLKRAYSLQPPHPKLLVLTNPHNPLGVNYDKQLLEDICTWAMEETDLHVISDEMYAHSQVATARPKFTSILALDTYRRDRNSDRMHMVWGLGKDFGLSGFRVGFVVSTSDLVRTALKGDEKRQSLSWFGPLDSLKNVFLRRLFDTTGEAGPWYAGELMQEYGSRLTDAHQQVRQALDEADVPYVQLGRNNPAQFFLLDLRDYLGRAPARRAAATEPVLFPEIDPTEEDLRAYLAEQANVRLLPGLTLSCPAPGYFRLCFTAYDTRTVTDAVRDIGAALDKLPGAPS